jgi:flavodoxin
LYCNIEGDYPMKILICYHSQSGNTERIARAMASALESEDVTIMPAADVDPASMGDYELAVLGSGVYSAEVGDSIKKLVKKAAPLPSRLAFFTTHSNPDPNMWKNAFKKIRKAVEEAGSTIVSEFECRGENTVISPEMLLNLFQGNQEMVDTYFDWALGCPTEEDEENARAFAQSLIS